MATERKQQRLLSRLSGTIAELDSLQIMHTLTEQERRLVFEKQMEIFQRIREWR